MRTILGIDPGSRVTGYGVIRSNGHTHHYIASGVIRVAPTATADRLVQIFQAVTQLVSQYQPQQTAIEQVFLAHNVNSALKLGQARGAAMVALAQRGLSVAEYSARAVKQAVASYGAAEKKQVQYMVKWLLKLSDIPSKDAADALAIAICHAQTHRLL